MKIFQKIASTFTLLLLLAPAAVSAASLTVQNLTPGTSVTAKNKVAFSLVTTGFTAYTYQIQDSFSGSSVALTNIDGGGNFQWVPLPSDVGTHTLTITSRDFNDNSAIVTQTITVLPLPSISIGSISGTSVLPGKAFTFLVTQSGFNNPTYLVGDDFSGGSTIGNANINSTGLFSWVPDVSQNGKHRITVYANDSQGRSASASVDVQVGAGPRLVAQLTSTTTTIKPGNFVSFNIAAAEFNPTGYSLSDDFAGKSSVSNANLNSAGQFWWMPQGSDVGVHKITIYAQVGAFGDKASTTQTVTVLSPDGTLPQPSSIANQPANASSTTLSALQAQLATLMAKMNSVGAPSAVSSASGYVFTSYLKPGSKGEEVLELQNLLARLGLLTATPNGYFGVGTTAAVKEFQKQHGLEPLGVVGPGTRAALNALPGATSAASITRSTNDFKFEHFMGFGDDDSPDVEELQKKLQAMGYLSLSAPLGFYGTATESAVKKFQAARGLPQTGYCDKITRAELNK